VSSREIVVPAKRSKSRMYCRVSSTILVVVVPKSLMFGRSQEYLRLCGAENSAKAEKKA
jgi:hypothetical protein